MQFHVVKTYKKPPVQRLQLKRIQVRKITRQAKLKGAVPHHGDEQEPTSAKENTGKKRQGAAYYGSSFKKECTKQWSFIRAAKDLHSFHCTMCAKNVSCKHQGRAVKRLIGKNIHRNYVKRIEGQNKVPYVSNQDPLTEKVCLIFLIHNHDENEISDEFPWSICSVR